MRKLICFIIIFSVIDIFPGATFAFKDIKIQNHSFAVISEEQPPSSHEQISRRSSFFIKNDNCNIKLKAMSGAEVLDGRSAQVLLSPMFIQLGENVLKIKCLPYRDVMVEAL